MRLAVLFAFLLLMGGTVTDASTETPQWPALPSKGFIFGRPATQQDVADGNAVFSAEKDGKVIGTPLSIQIPQYAFWDDGKGHKIPVIVVQAELANGFEMAGLRNAKGEDLACTLPELTLLGQTHP
jgi:hypothetical protein